jgi:hypothetical protein
LNVLLITNGINGDTGTLLGMILIIHKASFRCQLYDHLIYILYIRFRQKATTYPAMQNKWLF